MTDLDPGVRGRWVGNGLVLSLFFTAAVGLDRPAAAQSSEQLAPALIAGPFLLHGPDERVGRTAELCATNLGRRTAELAFDLRDAARLGEVLNAADLRLGPGEGACLSYEEAGPEARRVVGMVAPIVGEDWSVLNRSLAATLSVRDGTSNTIMVGEAYAGLRRQRPRGRAGSPGPREHRAKASSPEPVDVAGPFPLDGAVPGQAADSLEVCVTNTAITTNVDYTVEVTDTEDAGVVLASLEGVLAGGEGKCLAYVEPELASRRVLALVSTTGGTDWSAARRSLLSTATLTDGLTGATIPLRTRPAISLLPAVQ